MCQSQIIDEEIAVHKKRICLVTQLAKMSIDPKFVEVAADVVRIML